MNSPELFINVMRERTWSSPGFFKSNFERVLQKQLNYKSANHDRSGDSSVHAGRPLEKKAP